MDNIRDFDEFCQNSTPSDVHKKMFVDLNFMLNFLIELDDEFSMMNAKYSWNNMGILWGKIENTAEIKYPSKYCIWIDEMSLKK